MRTRQDADERPHPSRLAPDHPAYAEILAAHRRAVACGEATYPDPLSGYWVMTAPALTARGSCCDNGCRHCPFVGTQGSQPGTVPARCSST